MKKTKLGNADSRNAAIFLLKSASNSIMNGDSYCAYGSAIDAINVLKNNISDKDIKHLNKRDICVERFFMASLKGGEIMEENSFERLFKKTQALVNHDRAADEREGLEGCFELQQLENELQQYK